MKPSREHKRQSMEQRIKIPLDGADIELFTEEGTLVTKGYTRVVIGGRGPYIEFTQDQVAYSNIFIPNEKSPGRGDRTTPSPEILLLIAPVGTLIK